MPIDSPVFPSEKQITLSAGNTTDAYCTNPLLALDNDPTTFANFTNILPSVNVGSLSATSFNEGNDPPPYGIPILTAINVGETGFLWVVAYPLSGTVGVPFCSGGNLSAFELIAGPIMDSAGNTGWLYKTTVLANAADQTIECAYTGSGVGYKLYGSFLTIQNYGGYEVSLILQNQMISLSSGVLETVGGTYLSPAYNTLCLAFLMTQQYVVNPGPAWQVLPQVGTGFQNFQSLVGGDSGDNAMSANESSSTTYSQGATITPSFQVALDGSVPPQVVVWDMIAISIQPAPISRFLKVFFFEPIFVSRVRVLQNGPGALFSGFDFISPFSGEGIPLPYVPLPVDGEPQPPPADSYSVSELTFPIPVYAEGIIFYPDAYDSSEAYAALDLYQVQVYAQEGSMALTPNTATSKQVRNGVQQIMLFPWVEGLAYPFTGSPTTVLYGLQTFSKTVATGTAIETGGETPADLNGYVYSQEVKLKITNEEEDLYYEYLQYNGAFQTIAASPGQVEQQYVNLNQFDFTNNPENYVTIVAIGTRGNGSYVHIAPKCIPDGNFVFSMERNKVTDFESDWRVLLDKGYPWSNGGGTGASMEGYYVDGPLQSFNPS